MIDFENFTHFTFDCYGTLIDWENGILTAFAPVLKRQRGLAQSKTWRSFTRPPNIAKRLGLRQSSTAFSSSVARLGQVCPSSISRARSKRQRTGVVPDLAEFPAAPNIAKRLGLR